MKRASSALKVYGGAATGTGPRSTARMRPSSQTSNANTTATETQDTGSGLSAEQPALNRDRTAEETAGPRLGLERRPAGENENQHRGVLHGRAADSSSACFSSHSASRLSSSLPT